LVPLFPQSACGIPIKQSLKRAILIIAAKLKLPVFRMVKTMLRILLTALFLVSQANAANNKYDKLITTLEGNSVDSERLRELFNMQVSDWKTLTPYEKEMAVKGMAINLEMFPLDTRAAVNCVNNNGHGMKLEPSEDLTLPLARCVGDVGKR
jgi:hypothetical protein